MEKVYCLRVYMSILCWWRLYFRRAIPKRRPWWLIACNLKIFSDKRPQWRFVTKLNGPPSLHANVFGKSHVFKYETICLSLNILNVLKNSADSMTIQWFLFQESHQCRSAYLRCQGSAWSRCCSFGFFIWIDWLDVALIALLQSFFFGESMQDWKYWNGNQNFRLRVHLGSTCPCQLKSLRVSASHRKVRCSTSASASCKLK